MRKIEITDNQRKLLSKWQGNEDFWKTLTTNQRDIVGSVYKTEHYTEKQQETLNNIREQWIRHTNPNILLDKNGFNVSMNFSGEVSFSNTGDYIITSDKGYIRGDNSGIIIYSK